MAENSSSSRIFIAGLGPNVTADDLNTTFKSLGTLSNIEILRSGGRNFGFMDFVPSSEKSLDKLFAKYNGCAWKGGKLRLEKAKETYLDRLKREWAEDAKESLIAESEVKKEAYVTSKAAHVNPEKMQLRIFFPNSKKVKTLPFKGSGKHKYSFQRLEISSRPIDFCGCEEHFGSPEAKIEQYLSTVDSLAHAKERNIMTTVMNKFLSKGDNEVLKSGNLNFAPDAKCVDGSNNEMLVEGISEVDDIDEETEEDNFVTNIGTGQGDEMLTCLVGMEAQNVAKKPRINKLQPPEDDMVPLNSNHSWERQNTALPDDSEVKSRSVLPHKIKRKTSKDLSDSTLTTNKSLKELEKQDFVEVSPQKSQIEHKTSHNTADTRNSWIQKSSWRNLVGDSSNSMFSISNVLPGIGSVETKASNDMEKRQSNSKASRSLQNALHLKEAEVLDADSDNLVMNIVIGQSFDLGREIESMDQVQQFSNYAPEPTKNEPHLNKEHSEDQNIEAMVDHEDTLPELFSGTVAAEDSNANNADKNIIAMVDHEDTLPEMLSETLAEENSNADNADQNITAEVSPDKQTVHTSTSKPATGVSWIQKSAWRDLVSETGNSSFSISNVIPETKLVVPKRPSAGDPVAMPAIAQKKRKSHDAEVSQPLEAEEKIKVDMHGDNDKSEDSKEKGNEEHQKTDDQEYKRSIPKIEIGQVCTFMRTAESEKEWKKAKKALSGLLNKKSSDRKNSKNSQGKR